MELREAVVLASRHYLRTEFPIGWCEMTHQEVIALMRHNVMPHACYNPPETIYRQIENLAILIMEIVNGTTD